MAKYILKRVGLMAITLFIVITFTFFMMQVMPGTPFNNPKLTPEAIASLEKTYGLDRPLFEQYINYVVNAVQGGFGMSFTYANQLVSDMISQRLPVSAQLGLQALILGIPLGILIGSVSARKKNSKIDAILGFVSTIGISVPNFIIGMFLLMIFGYALGIAPVTWDDTDWFSSLLPTIALSIAPMAVVTRFVRSEMIESLSSDYIQLARAKGLSETEVVNRHAVRNSLIPILTLIGPMVANLLTGSVIVENLFSIPGIGQQFVNSIPSKDFPVIMGTTIVYSIMLMVSILITDILTAVVDPRVRLK